MRADGGQLELLPSEAPGIDRARLHLSDVLGYETATPSRELVELIAKLGLLQPIIVAGSPQSRYRVIEGRRRAKAVQLLVEDGRWPAPPRVDALIVEGVDGAVTVQSAMALALHAARSASPASELAAIESILAKGEDEAATIKDLAAQTGMAVQTVRRRLRLRGLCGPLRQAFDRGEITVSVAEAVARQPEAVQRMLTEELERGEPLRLTTVRELARRRSRRATLELPEAIFSEHEAPWRVTVRGHLQAALDALPADDGGTGIGRAIEAALGCVSSDATPAPPDDEIERRR